MQIQSVFAPVRADFERVNDLIQNQLFSNVPLVEKIGHYIIDAGGKRLRPLLVLLTARALGQPHEGRLKLAAVIEFLHTATLLHDDVVDTSDMRRGRSTANARWGNAPSVLVGDFLYSRAFQMMVELGNMEVMQILAEATNVIAEGEVLQLTNCRNPDITDEQYMDVIIRKTAMLFQAASHSAAALCGASETQAARCRDYGLHLGISFQLIDDVLDYEGDSETLGKNVGDDLAEGKPTLPLLYAMRAGNTAERTLIRKAIRQGGEGMLEEVVAAVRRTGALDYTRELARSYADKARTDIHQLDESEAREALLGLADLAINRST
ncbi:MAG: octaprenyl diphosphate synthase [Gammaproteobacteria bacterium]|nr:MAG: octaprenyl diphosphate synthase [Gammaproteobacteria bacterium]